MVDSGKAARAIRKAVRCAVTEAAEAALARVADGEGSRAPGAPAPKPPKAAEPTKPVELLPPGVVFPRFNSPLAHVRRPRSEDRGLRAFSTTA